MISASSCADPRTGRRSCPATLLAIVTLFLLPAALAAQDPAPAPRAWTPPPLFESDSVLELTIRTDLRRLVNDRDSTRRERHEATISMIGADGTPVSIDARLRTRGHFRRQARICDFPPIQVSFDGGTRGTPFARQGNLKLVTRCQSRRDEFEQYILQEYLLYRTYNAVTPLSFRVRLARITYEDTQGRHPGLVTYAFFLEPERDMARRNGGLVLDTKGARLHDLEAEDAHLMAMWQFMVGNTDWSVAGLHNVVLVRSDTAGAGPLRIRAVPYDMDWAGAVNTRYARPDYRLPIRSVRERLYRGYCVPAEQLQPAVAQLAERRAAMEAAFAEVPGLAPATAASMRGYFEDFWRIVNDPRALQREIGRACLPP